MAYHVSTDKAESHNRSRDDDRPARSGGLGQGRSPRVVDVEQVDKLGVMDCVEDKEIRTVITRHPMRQITITL